MSNKKNNDSLITDETTLMRRAWIDLALNSVRSQLNVRALEKPELVAAGNEQPDSFGAEQSRRSQRPQLYLAYSATKPRRGLGS